MLSSTLLGAFTTPVTYVLFFVLLSTAVLQVRYVNKALQRFDSTQVIPIQFVLFTLSVIIGSAVLYRDFERTSAEQAAKFVGGCLLTFFGVFLITSGRPPTDHDEEALSDDDDIDETIRLAEQEPSAPQAAAPRPPSRRASDAARPRRSRTSRVSFKESLRPGSFIADSGIPSHRSPSHASNLRLSLSNEDLVDSPLLTNPWREGLPYASRPQHPNVEHAIHSSDSVPLAAPISASDMLSPSTPQAQLPQTKTRDLPDPHNTNSHLIAIERPMTPRPSASGGGGSGGSRPHSHHCGGALISPSPFSSTVSAVVADKLLAHMDSPTLRRVLSRRSRRSLRNSLYVPADELYADGEYSDLENQLESAIEPGYGRESGHEADQLLPSGQTSIRTRARSLSHTLGDLFSGKKKMSLSSLDEDEQGKVAGREVPSTAEASESRDAL